MDAGCGTIGPEAGETAAGRGRQTDSRSGETRAPHGTRPAQGAGGSENPQLAEFDRAVRAISYARSK